MPHAEHYGGLDGYIEKTTAPGGWWGNADAYMVSLLKAWWGAAATPENDFCFDYLPRIDDDNSNYWTVEQMLDGQGQGVHRRRREPGGRLGERQARTGSRSRSSTGSSCATSSRSRRRRSGTTAPRSSRASWRPSRSRTEVFFLPAASHLEKDGSFTNTQRLLQWHYKAVEPKEDCRSELWFYYHLGKMIKERLQGVGRPDATGRSRT